VASVFVDLLKNKVVDKTKPNMAAINNITIKTSFYKCYSPLTFLEILAQFNGQICSQNVFKKTARSKSIFPENPKNIMMTTFLQE
jgi:hypothetical protein